jgi:hypothetical protein
LHSKGLPTSDRYMNRDVGWNGDVVRSDECRSINAGRDRAGFSLRPKAAFLDASINRKRRWTRILIDLSFQDEYHPPVSARYRLRQGHLPGEEIRRQCGRALLVVVADPIRSVHELAKRHNVLRNIHLPFLVGSATGSRRSGASTRAAETF